MSGSGAAELGLAVPDAAAMTALGRLLGETAPDGATLLIQGPLGAGKTTLVQGVGAGCGVTGPITSPTYTLVVRYRGRRPLTHVDLFRLSGPDELATLDLDDVLDAPGVTCVEWPELVAARAVPPLARIRIAVTGGSRWLGARLEGPGWGAARAGLAGAGAASA